MLFAAGIAAGQLVLVLVAAVASAISAWYYLRLIGLSLLSSTTPQSESVKATLRWPLIAAVISAIIAIGGSLGTVYAKKVAHSMMSLIFAFMAVAGVFILQEAEFLAAIQILVYLASVMLVVLFGVMLTRTQIMEDFE